MLVEVGRGIFLSFQESGGARNNAYPTWPIQKGLVLVCEGRELVEEGTGFGLPLVRFGHRTVFPGDAEVTAPLCESPLRRTSEDQSRPVITVNYRLNLVEVAAVRGVGTIRSAAFYQTREFFSSLHRRHAQWRPVLTSAADNLKRLSGMQTTFEPGADAGSVKVVYTVYADQGIIHVSADLQELKRPGLTEIIMANEQGAGCFDSYRDSRGITLKEDAIGTWGEVSADEASFIDSSDNIVFTLARVPACHAELVSASQPAAARMFRGRELAPGRLAWSGLAYVLPPQTTSFTYDIRLEKAR